MLSQSPIAITPIAKHGNSTPNLSFAASPPTSARSQTFKRPASSDEEDGDAENGGFSASGRGFGSRRNAVVKRACNECRQQKLKCDVQQDPFVSCARCTKHNFKCVIEPNFKRIGKRTRNAEMEKEMEHLREQLAMYQRGVVPPQQPTLNTPQSSTDARAVGQGFAQEDDALLQSQHQQSAASSLLELRSGSPMMHCLDNVRLPPSHVTELFTEFFEHYHSFLPFLDPTRSPDEVSSKDSKLLFWAIISVAARHYVRDGGLLNRLKEPLTNLIWQTVKGQTNHHVVKALCLLCYWPLPQRRTVMDPTFMLCGLMMQTAIHIGLHQPTHPQDFSRKKVRLQEEDIHDRLRTWAVCNIVAQTVSTGYGQPSMTMYDSTLDFKIDDDEHMRIIPPDLFVRLRQEMAAGRINKLLYSTNRNRFTEGTELTYMQLEADRLKEEQGAMDGVNKALEELHHCAVSLHLHLFSFFNREARLSRRDDLVALYYSATAFLERVFLLQRENRLIYAPYHIMQLALAAGFALLKLLNSDFASKLPAESGRQFVLQTVEALRKAKVETNDLLDRFAEVLAQLWKESSRGRSLHSVSQSPVVGNPGLSSMFNGSNHRPSSSRSQNRPNSHHRRESSGMLEDPLGLIVRSRMSMSVVFDCVWRWRESQITNTAGDSAATADAAAEQLDATVRDNPTNPDSSTSSTPPPNAPGHGVGVGAIGSVENPAHGLPNFNPHLNTLSMPLQLPNGLASANSYEFFDSVSWMLETQDWNNGPFSGGGFGTDFGS